MKMFDLFKKYNEEVNITPKTLTEESIDNILNTKDCEKIFPIEIGENLSDIHKQIDTTTKFANWENDIITAKQTVRKGKILNKFKKYICKFLSELQDFIIENNYKIPQINIHFENNHCYIDITISDKELTDMNINIYNIDNFEIEYMYKGVCRYNWFPEKPLFEEFKEIYNYCLEYTK